MAINIGSVLATLDLDTSPFAAAMTSAQGQLGGFEKSGMGTNKVVDALQKGIGGVGRVLATAGIGMSLTQMTVSAVKTGMEFDAQMSRVGAISNATTEEFNTLRAAAIQMGADSVFGATDAAKAMEYMGMAGWNSQQMLDGLPGIINLAAASGEDLGAVSDIVTDALTAFGLSAGDSAHFADILAAASTNSNTNVGLMGETFKYVAPLAGALGYSAEDCAVAIGLMANSGIKGSQAGTALRSLLTRLSKPTKDVAEAMEQYGISLTDAQGNMLPFSELTDELRGVFDGLSESQKAQLASTLAGQEGMSGLLAIVNASEADYRKLTEAVQTCDGATQTMADKILDNLKGDVEGFSGAVEGLALKFSDLVTPALRGVVQWATGAVDWLSGLTDKLTTASGASGVLESALKGIGKVDWTALSETVGTVATKLMENVASAITGKAEKAMSILSAIVTCVSGVDWSSVLGTVGTIATGLLDSIGKAIPSLTGSALSLLDAIITGIGNVSWDSVGTSLAGVATGLLDGLMDNLPATIEGAGKIVEKIGDGISAAGEALGTAAKALVTGLVTWLLSADNWSKLLTVGTSIVKGICIGIVDLGGSLLKGAADILTGIIEGIFSPMTEAMGITDYASAVKEEMDQLYVVLDESGQQLAMEGNALMNSLLEPIQDTSGLTMALQAWKLALATGCSEGYEDAQWLGNAGVVKLFAAMTNTAASEAERAKAMAALTMNGYGGIVASAISGDPAAYGAIQAACSELMKGANLTIEQAVGELGGAIPASIKQGLEAGVPALQSASDEVAKIASGTQDKVDTLADAKAVGQETTTSFAAGQSDKQGEVEASAQGVSDAVTTTLEPLPGLMEELGKNGITGMATGELAAQSEVTAASQTISTEAVNTALRTMSVQQGTTIGKGFASAVASGISGQRGSIGSAALGAGNSGAGALRGILSSGSGYAIGRDMIQGVINGIASMTSSLSSRMRSVANSAVSAFRNALQMHSPSRVLMADGALIPTSYALGVERNKSEAVRSMVSLARDMQNAWPGLELDEKMTPKANSGILYAGESGGIVFQFYGDMTVREEADIQRISAELREEFVEELRGRGY